MISNPTDRVYGLVALGIGAFWAVGFAYATQPALPHSALQLPYAEQMRSTVWAPQGWSFFTRDAREQRLVLYRRSPAGWEMAIRGPNARPSNAFGFNRASRAQGTELAVLSRQIPDTQWIDCTGPMNQCLDKLPAPVKIQNRVPVPVTCGRLAFVFQAPVPWAWLTLPKKVHMPVHAALAEVAC